MENQLSLKQIQDLRQSYSAGELHENMVGETPMPFFERWFQEAMNAQVNEPNAMALATASETGLPSCRFVLMKGIETDAIVFYTNYESRKGQELEKNPYAAATFWWPELERQVRIEGRAERLSYDESVAYFQSRPPGSRIGAWASPQSEIIRSREELEKRQRDYEERFRDKEVPLPEFWGGYRLVVFSVEFWQGRPNRLHDRIFFTHNEEGVWQKMRLAP
jgi:pyridoxamine 5'-phosphate oxidase